MIRVKIKNPTTTPGEFERGRCYDALGQSTAVVEGRLALFILVSDGKGYIGYLESSQLDVAGYEDFVKGVGLAAPGLIASPGRRP